MPFCDKILTTIFILFSTWLYNYKPADYITKYNMNKEIYTCMHVPSSRPELIMVA